MALAKVIQIKVIIFDKYSHEMTHIKLSTNDSIKQVKSFCLQIELVKSVFFVVFSKDTSPQNFTDLFV